MACAICGSSNETEFPAEVNIHFRIASEARMKSGSLYFRDFWSALTAALPRS